MDAYNNMVISLRNYKAQEVKGRPGLRRPVQGRQAVPKGIENGLQMQAIFHGLRLSRKRSSLCLLKLKILPGLRMFWGRVPA